MKKAILAISLCTLLSTSCAVFEKKLKQHREQSKSQLEETNDSDIKRSTNQQIADLKQLWFKESDYETGNYNFIEYDNNNYTLHLKKDNSIIIGIENTKNCLITTFLDENIDGIVDKASRVSKDITSDYVAQVYTRSDSLQRNSHLEVIFQEEFLTHLENLSNKNNIYFVKGWHSYILRRYD